MPKNPSTAALGGLSFTGTNAVFLNFAQPCYILSSPNN